MSSEWLMLLMLVPIYLAPTIVAVQKKHPYKVAIILVNVIGGLFYGVGWLVALVWCFVVPKDVSVNAATTAKEIEELHALLQKGVLTEEEFKTKKDALLRA